MCLSMLFRCCCPFNLLLLFSYLSSSLYVSSSFFFFFKQKTAYEMHISDWSSDVCSSDLDLGVEQKHQPRPSSALCRCARSSAASPGGAARNCAIFSRSPLSCRHASMLLRTWVGRPRSVTTTGPTSANPLARLTS